MDDEVPSAAAARPDRHLADLIARAAGPLLEGDNFFREVLDTLPAPVYTTDAAGYVTYFNDAAAAIWGQRPELGKAKWCGSWRMFWPDGRELSHEQCPMAIAVKERRAIRGLEAMVERPDGSRVSLIPFPTPLYDDTGSFLGAVNLLVDISERKGAEEAAHYLAAIVESSNDAIISKDLGGIIKSWNKGAERIFGYEPKEIVGKSIKTLISPEHHAEEDLILDRLRRGERIEHFETTRRRKDGSLIDVSLTISPVKDAHGKLIGVSKITRDITERKRAEAQIAILAREAEHRSRNILATVAATVQLSQADTPEGLKKAIEGRVRALSNAHALFVASRWTGADLQSLVQQELSPYCQDGERRAQIAGPEILLEPNLAQCIAVALHELATNAAKYGALSVPQGRVQINWGRSPSGHVVIRWVEADGPPAEQPERTGFGTRVMQTMIRQLNGEIRFHWLPEGLACEIVLSV
jgi:PAS domain S-box-containing protein